jgi:hypothetical protein
MDQHVIDEVEREILENMLEQIYDEIKPGSSPES